MGGAREDPIVSATYVLGHSRQELDRLTTHARLVDPMTRRFFVQAGVGPGMRVLDVGSGPGDVAFLAADLVGPKGEAAEVGLSTLADRMIREAAKNQSVIVGRLEVGAWSRRAG